VKSPILGPVLVKIVINVLGGEGQSMLAVFADSTKRPLQFLENVVRIQNIPAEMKTCEDDETECNQLHSTTTEEGK